MTQSPVDSSLSVCPICKAEKKRWDNTCNSHKCFHEYNRRITLGRRIYYYRTNFRVKYEALIDSEDFVS